MCQNSKSDSKIFKVRRQCKTFARFRFQVFWWQKLQIFQVSILWCVCFPFPFPPPTCIFSIAATLIIAVPQVQLVHDVCRSCRSQSITEVDLSGRNLGYEEVKAPNWVQHRFPGGRGNSVVDNVPCASQLHANCPWTS